MSKFSNKAFSNSYNYFFFKDNSIFILISSGNKVGAKTYQDLVKITLGKFGFIVLTLIQFLYPFICKYFIYLNKHFKMALCLH